MSVQVFHICDACGFYYHTETPVSECDCAQGASSFTRVELVPRGSEFERARPTRRRESAVELLHEMGWQYSDGAWRQRHVPEIERLPVREPLPGF